MVSSAEADQDDNLDGEGEGDELDGEEYNVIEPSRNWDSWQEQPYIIKDPDNQSIYIWKSY